MIKSFKHKGLKRFYVEHDARLLNQGQLQRIRNILVMLDTAESMNELNVAGSHLHELKGTRKGTWSMKVSGNWRITFLFQDGDAFDVNLEDYH